jgi:hypothetical protein
VGFIQHRAQLLLEGEGIEPGQEILQRRFDVLAVEKVGVGEAGADDLLVAVAHAIGVLLAAVAHDNKVGHQVAVAIDHGKVTLVLFHHRDQHGGGQLEVFLLKVAQQRGGLLDQICHFVQQLGVVGDRAAHTGG